MGRLCDRLSDAVVTDTFFEGEEREEEEYDVREVRHLILSGKMKATIAKQLVDGIKEATIASTYSFCLYLAALTATFPEEVSYRATDGRSISEILHTATAPSRIV